MPYALMPLPKIRFFDANGNPLAGGKVYTYEPGTSTPKATYTDANGTTQNANPVILDSNGEASIWLNGFYKIILKNSADVVQWTQDKVSAMPAESTIFSEWLTNGLTPTYISATQFSVPGDETSRFQVGRRVKCTVSAGTVYGTIKASAYTTLTTVTVTLDSGNLDSGLSTIAESVLSVTSNAIPGLYVIPRMTTTQRDTYTAVNGMVIFNSTTSRYQIYDGSWHNMFNEADYQSGSKLFVVASGTDTYTATFNPALSTLTTGMRLWVYFTNGNTVTAPTLNPDGLGAKIIKRQGGQALVPGDIQATWLAMLEYNGTDFFLLNPAYHDHSEASKGGKIGASGITGGLGGRDDSKSVNTVYQAATDLIISVTFSWNAADGGFQGLADSSNPPTTNRNHAKVTNPATENSITFAVKKNEYWKINPTGTTPTVNQLSVIALGS